MYCIFILQPFFSFQEITSLVDQLTKELFPEMVKEMADHRFSELRQLARYVTATKSRAKRYSVPISTISCKNAKQPVGQVLVDESSNMSHQI